MLQVAKQLGRRLKYENWRGYCPICEKPVRFHARGKWYRDQLLCGSCSSLPRERALMRVIDQLYPNWRELDIHESSPAQRGASLKLAQECRGYVGSQYLPDVESGGSNEKGQLNQNLEKQTFADERFDLVITQDVFEHLFRPDQAIREIVRTLKPGGAHIMTVPIVNKDKPSARRASEEDGQITHLREPEYHGNPVGDGASLVTFDWGYDLSSYLAEASGYPTTIVQIEDRSQGIVAEYLDILITRKAQALPLLD